MWKVMLGVACLFIGTQSECEAIESSMVDAGQQVKATAMVEGENVFDVL